VLIESSLIKLRSLESEDCQSFIIGQMIEKLLNLAFHRMRILSLNQIS